MLAEVEKLGPTAAKLAEATLQIKRAIDTVRELSDVIGTEDNPLDSDDVIGVLEEQVHACAAAMGPAVMITDHNLACAAKHEQQDDQEHLELWGEVESIKKFVDANCRPDTEIYKLFRATEREDENVLPDRDALRKARDAFFALKEYQRRGILNGWDTKRAPRMDDVRKLGCDIQHKLTVDSKPRNFALHEWVIDESNAPVRVEIACGTTKKQALAELAKLRRIIEKQWGKWMEDLRLLSDGSKPE